VARVSRDGMALWSRHGTPLAGRVPCVASALGGLPAGTVLDGELVALRAGADGRVLQDWDALGALWRSGAWAGEVDRRLICFDCLEAGGRRLDELPCRARRERLEALVHGAPPSACLTPVSESDPAVHAHLVGLGFEGSVLKRASSRYRRGQRSRSWLKHKHRRHADVLVRFVGRDRRTGGIDRAAFTEPDVAGLQWASLGTPVVRELLERGAQDVPGRIAFSHRSARGGAREARLIELSS
jgi:ATP-dependent DNA ligase